jgi:hypothetical protein
MALRRSQAFAISTIPRLATPKLVNAKENKTALATIKETIGLKLREISSFLGVDQFSKSCQVSTLVSAVR